MNKDQILAAIGPPVDKKLAEQLLETFCAGEEKYFLRDWKGTIVEVGQFIETASRVLYQLDTTVVDYRRGVEECVSYLQDRDKRGQQLATPNIHKATDIKSLRHISRVLTATYKIRSDRGAVHISAEYSANEMDARLLTDSARWILGDILRITWQKAPGEVAAIIKELVRFKIPSISNVEDRTIVLRTDLTVDEEILMLLMHTGEQGLSRNEIGKSVMSTPSSITKSLAKLCSKKMRLVATLPSTGRYVLTESGKRHVTRELASKLSI